jgi:endonuclease I
LTRHLRFAAALYLAAALTARLALADAYDPPDGYYSGATGTGASLKSQLNTIIKTGHTPISYDAARSALQITDDATPNNPNDHLILLVYDRVVLNVSGLTGPPPGWDFGDSWDREHTWPQSRGLGSTSAPDGSDLHALRPSTPDVNNDRGNSNFGGAFNSQPASGEPFGYVDDNGVSLWYPGNADAGMIARHSFYMAVRYDGAAGTSTTDLELTDGNPNIGGSLMGEKTRLIEWHFAAPPDSFERRRNQIIYDNYQFNRNPFIDRPEFVWSVFVDQPNDSRITIDGTTPDTNGGSNRNVDLGRVFTGSAVPATQTFTLNKAGNDGTFYEVTTGGLATSSILGRFNAFATNQPGARPITVGLNTNTAVAGLRSGTVTVNNLDVTAGGCGGIGCGANDANDTFNVSLTVLDHATPSFSNTSTTSLLTHDFGIRTTASAAPTFDFNVFNRNATPGFTAKLDFDSVAGSGSTSALTTNADAFDGVLQLAGGTGQALTATMSTSAVGSFSATYALNFSDENIAGALSSSLTLALSGQVLLAGDFNRDHAVDTADYAIWQKSYGQTVAAYSLGDGNGDTVVDDNDLWLWQKYFGISAGGGGVSPAGQVPEPSLGPALLALGGALASHARFRNRMGFGRASTTAKTPQSLRRHWR